ncbi:MAG: hypothetical protein JO363_05330 [Solirubrobacterales bacterium]|nr:hypothetical protein [Solirubrobacterales bacterium]
MGNRAGAGGLDARVRRRRLVLFALILIALAALALALSARGATPPRHASPDALSGTPPAAAYG